MSSFDANHHKSKSMRLVYGDEPLQFGDLYVPDQPGPYPVVILIHGGFWRAAYSLSLMEPLAIDLVRRGIAVWNIEYRRVGDPGGGWPGTLQDVARANDYLKTVAESHALDLQRVVAVGHSAGGHLALWSAIQQRVTVEDTVIKSAPSLQLAGVISLAGACDLEHVWQRHLGNDAVVELLGGGPNDVPERYAAASPTAFLPLGIPQVLIHGTLDDRVPLAISRSYVAKATATGDKINLIVVDDADHFVLINPTSVAWSITINQIQQLLSLTV